MNNHVQIATEPETQNETQRRPPSAFWSDRRRLFLITLAAATVVFAQYQFWKQPVRGDAANWDYFAQVIARGGLPYRDVVNIKSPLSAYIGALAIVAARPFGLRDVYAIRIVYLIMAVFTVGFTYLVTYDYFESHRIALLAATIMLTFEPFGIFNSRGVQPKTPMVLFGLMTLWAIHKRWPIAAGVFGMLSALSWQPGLLFVGAAGLAFSRYLRDWRDGKVLKLLAGAGAPLAVMVAYFAAAGALKDFYLWGFHYTSTVYGPRELRPLSSFFGHLGGILASRFPKEQIYFYLAAIGIVMAIGIALKEVKDQGWTELFARAPRHAIIIAPAVYFGFCMIDIQGIPDLIPLLPFVGAFAALALIYSCDWTAKHAMKMLPRIRPALWQYAPFMVFLIAILVLDLGSLFSYRRGFPTLQDEDAATAEITSHLGPGDKIFVHGQTEILELSQLTNASKYFFLDRGKDTYLDKVEPGGFAGWFDRLKAERPKVIALSRLDAVDHAAEFREWANEDYEARKSLVFPYFVRKD